ncbi:MAG TPA: DUF4159 domain-containing protein [Rhodothermales bacterium]|nr:DUF4159 domain-containing protein [Rhodothermales bacterium]
MRALIIASLLLAGFIVLRPTPAPVAESEPAPSPAPAEVGSQGHGFRFVRIRYEGVGYGRRGRSWAYDWPTAEQNLYTALERTTVLHLDGEPIVLTLEDDRIFEYPILYLCEPGYWQTNDEEVANLQEYFARGGFLIIDDFHDYGGGRKGPEWENFYANIKRVFPDREPIELPADHPIWRIYYDIDPDAAVSTKIETGEVPWLGPDDDTYYGIFDDNGRMLVVICYNQDIGDGWEWPDRNLQEGSTVSFQMAINFIMYALSH